MDIFFLHQADPLIMISDSGTQGNLLNSEETDPGHDLEGSDLSEYLRVKAKIDDINDAFQSIGNQGVLINPTLFFYRVAYCDF